MKNKSNSDQSITIDVLKSPYYGMVYLGLANAAYTCEGSKNDAIHDSFQKLFDKDNQSKYLPQLPDVSQAGDSDPQNIISGYWSLDWGPAIADDNSNLIYIASYRINTPKSNTPIFYAVVIRGTDISTGPDGLINQIAQDIKDFKLYSWNDLLSGKLKDHRAPDNVTGVSTNGQIGNISNGSILGFTKLASLIPEKSTDDLAHAVKGLLDKYQAPIVVTGHSLGGNQAQVVAAYLDWQFGNQTTVIPQPFAPPTPGDNDFASLPVFANGQFWYNTFDLVPYAYIMVNNNTELGLTWANQNLWQTFYWPSTEHTPGPTLPGEIRVAIGTVGFAVPKVFSRPNKGGMIELEGSLPDVFVIKEFLETTNSKADPTGSKAQLMWQHFPPCYHELMWEQQSDNLVYYNYKSYVSCS